MDCVWVDVWEALLITWYAADFLINTNRCPPAIKFYKESLSLLNFLVEHRPPTSQDLTKIRRLQIGLYNRLAGAYLRIGKCCDSKANAKLAVAISKEIKNKSVERKSYRNLCAVFEALGRYDKMIKYGEKILQISEEIGDQEDEAEMYCNLGRLHYALGQYENARDYYLESANRSKKIGPNTRTERRALTSLGDVLCVLNKPQEGLQKLKEALKMSEEGKYPERAPILHLAGKACTNLFQYDKAMEYFRESVHVSSEINDTITEGEACCDLGNLLYERQHYDEAIKYLEKALEIAKITGEKYPKEGACIGLVGIYIALDQRDRAKEYKKKAMESIREEGKRIHTRSSALLRLGYALRPADGSLQEICDIFSESIRFFESEREPFKDEHKLSLGDKNQNFYGYKNRGLILIELGRVSEALCSLEQGRAQVLKEVVAKRYFIKEKVEFKKDSLCSLMGRLRKEQILVFQASIGTVVISWIMTNKGEVRLFMRNKSSTTAVHTFLKTALEENFRSLVYAREIECEDRSLSALYDSESAANDQQRKSAESDDEECTSTTIPNRLYHMFIASFEDRIEGREVVLVPEGSMFMIPFTSLRDDEGKYLSEKCRIRIIPSLTTLKLIQNCPADYHSQRGVLIVGDPDVSRVKPRLTPLPAARQEAKEIAELLNVSALLGEQATKGEVLRRITDVCLIHIAAHGDAVRGEIACTPNPSSLQVPRKEDFMLTEEDIAKIGIRAKLVVLSCCHSGRGKVMKAEGVVGIARAFIASGARSVLVSLWLLNDESTKEFMIRFYRHLVRDKMSASEALHQSIKWMRESKKYSVSDWAPFVLIGDDVTLDL